jgi:corrinoid protein of di/trimethylamine methyltransferase
MLLITLGRYLGSEIKNKEESRIRPKDRGIVSLAVREVMMGFSDPSMTLERIADMLYISKSTLSRLFRDATGKSFGDYLREVRVKSACALLCESSLTVEEIAGRCGLRDIATFYKTFSSITGMTPSVYRSHNKKHKELKNSNKGEKFMSILTEICENLQKGKAKIVKELCENAINEGLDPEIILNEGLLAGMNVIGEKFKNNEVYVPEVLVAARAMSMGAQILKPLLAASGVQATGKVCIGTVQGDLHDIGKNLVKMMMEGKGLEVVDLGTDVSPEAFIKAAVEENCQVICCSALLTTTMHVMEEVVKAATEAGIRDQVKIMIGGAPITDAYCQQIGADAYTPDAARAADVAVELCQMQKKSEVADDNA